MISMIAAVAENGAIGYKNRLLYWLPNDLKRFKGLTSGHTIIMGRRTFESLPKGALPNRRNIVLTRNSSFSAPGVEIFTSLHEALSACSSDEEVYIIGGASLYSEAMPYAERLNITHVADIPSEADAFFPVIDPEVWHIENEERHEADERHAFPYSFVDYYKLSKR
ncbi:MAG: dihydrofolate reductase [Bacteroidaceae bacterium]|nr:dihydrofolate reductase [Bacteroidaceae bacterium]